jgi:hypothetical protein
MESTIPFGKPEASFCDRPASTVPAVCWGTHEVSPTLKSTWSRGAAARPRHASLRCVLVGGVACLLMAGWVEMSQGQSFTVGVRAELATGLEPRSVAIGDVNGDGKADLVTANVTAGTVSVLLGNGAGGFGAKADFATGADPFMAAIGDVNGDGKADLAVANPDFNTVSVLLGDGAGGFGAATDFATGTAPVAVTIGDVSGDGKPDLVASNINSNTVSVLLGDGAGGFGANAEFASGAGPRSAAIGDVSGDGKPDLVVANYGSSTVSVLLGNGAGGFGAKTDFTTGSSPYEAAIGDVSGDGKLDLAVANNGAATVSVLLGNGAGGFGAKNDFAVGSFPRSIAIGDVSGDGRADLVTANVAASTVSVLLGNGAGGFGTTTDFAAGSSCRWIAIGDVSGDGKPDLATADFGANTVSVLLGNGAGGFGAKTNFATGDWPHSVAIGDVSGDGKPDLAVANDFANSLSVLLGNGAGGFGAKTDYATGINPNSIAIRDVSGDGKPDLVVSNYGSNSVSVRLGNGTGGFGAKTDFTTGVGPFSVAVADVSGDGKPDLATANRDGNTASVLLGNGTGGFGFRTDFGAGNQPYSVAIGDVSGDNKPDLAVANRLANTVSVLLGNGTGGFGVKTDYTTGTNPMSVAIGDVSGDGKPDLAVANNGSNTVSVLLGNGAGGFAAKTDFTAGSGPESVAIRDTNGDGRLDLVVANAVGNSVSVLLGNGAGGFGVKTDFTTEIGPVSVAIGDVSNDGRDDLAVANMSSTTVSVLLGLVPTRTSLAVNPNPSENGSPVTLTATVTVPAPGYGAPTDSVRFFDGTTLLGTSPVHVGEAVLTLPAPHLGERSLTAVYKGDGKLFGSISAVRKLHVVSFPVPMEVEATAGSWINPEPWHDWVSGVGEGSGDGAIPIQAHIPDHLGAIAHVEFYYSTNNGASWHLIANDVNGYEPPLNTLDTSVQMTGCGWSTEFAVPDSIPAGPIQFKTVAYPTSGDPVEDVTVHDYDPAPPSIGSTSITDRTVIDRDALGTDIYANGAVITRIIIQRSPMDTTFVKGIPGINQLAYDSMYCAPVAAAQCLQYFAGHGDPAVTGGLGTSGLVQALAVGMGTSQTVAGTLPSRWVSGVGAWIAAYGQGYTVRYYPHYSCTGSGSTWTRADWRRIRNELELCRDVLVGVFWDGGGGHALTLNSIQYPENPDGSITIGFKDPWTGGTATGDLNPATGHITNLGGAGGGGGGQIGLTMLVSRAESAVGGGVAGALVYDGPPPAGPPYHFEIPLPVPGYWFIHVTLVNERGHASRITNVVEYDPNNTSVPDLSSTVPRAFDLERGIPNPFSRETRVICAVPRFARVHLAVYDVTGREVRTLVDGEMQPGIHRVPWDGRDQKGRAVAGGIYYLRMTAPGFQRTTGVTILR